MKPNRKARREVEKANQRIEELKAQAPRRFSEGGGTGMSNTLTIISSVAISLEGDLTIVAAVDPHTWAITYDHFSSRKFRRIMGSHEWPTVDDSYVVPRVAYPGWEEGLLDSLEGVESWILGPASPVKWQ